MIGFFQFYRALSQILLIACADQLLLNSSLTKLCSACIKQNAKVKTVSDTLSLLAKQTLSGLVGKRTSSLIINFKQVFIFLVVDCTFYKSNIKSNCILLCHIRVRSRRQNVFCKKGVLRNFAKLTGKRLC